MRVIAGKLRSRTLHAPSGRDTRPTHDRVREALFSVLGDITNQCVLDLCAGTGALGIEAVSRGARYAVFVEQGKEALRCLTRNLTELDLLAQSTVIGAKVEASRSRLLPHGPYDLIFCDPPWVKVPELLLALGHLDLPNLLSAEGRLVLEHSAKFDSSHVSIAGLRLEAQRRWGDTAVTLFTVDRPPTAPQADGPERTGSSPPPRSPKELREKPRSNPVADRILCHDSPKLAVCRYIGAVDEAHGQERRGSSDDEPNSNQT